MAVTLGGNPIDVAGNFPKVGDTAPDFKLVNKYLTDVSLADFAGKKKILNIVPSLDTPVCATETKTTADIDHYAQQMERILSKRREATPCAYKWINTILFNL